MIPRRWTPPDTLSGDTRDDVTTDDGASIAVPLEHEHVPPTHPFRDANGDEWR